MFRKKLRQDLFAKEITDIVGNNIYYLHKPEDIKANIYIEYEILRHSFDDYSANTKKSDVYSIQVDIFTYEDFTRLADVILEKLTSLGYKLQDDVDMYEENTKLFHWGSRWQIKIRN